MTPGSTLATLPPAPAGRDGWPWTVETGLPANVGAVAWPRLTIVIPSYQQASYLEEAIRSVLLQNYPNLELIVIDGGSRDGSAEIIARYAPHLAYWQSKQDRGQGDAINQGFDRATGDIVGWLNSDDLYLPGALFAVADACLRERADIVYGDALNLHEERDHALQYWQGYWIHRSFLQFGGLFSSHAIFWRRTAHARIWDELNCNVDGELWQRLIPHRRVRYLPLPLGICRIYGQTKSNDAKWAQKWREDDALIWARHGRPSTNRIFLRYFHYSQRLFKWCSWRRNRAAKRAMLDACAWPTRAWIGPKP